MGFQTIGCDPFLDFFAIWLAHIQPPSLIVAGMTSKPILRVTVLMALASFVCVTPALAQAESRLPTVTMEQKTSLRCAAAFAIVAQGQSIGNEDALKWPAMDKRGREFFVRISAGLMDAADIDRNIVAALMQREAQTLWDAGEVHAVMPACLLLLEASGV